MASAPRTGGTCSLPAAVGHAASFYLLFGEARETGNDERADDPPRQLVEVKVVSRVTRYIEIEMLLAQLEKRQKHIEAVNQRAERQNRLPCLLLRRFRVPSLRCFLRFFPLRRAPEDNCTQNDDREHPHQRQP